MMAGCNLFKRTRLPAAAAAAASFPPALFLDAVAGRWRGEPPGHNAAPGGKNHPR